MEKINDGNNQNRENNTKYNLKVKKLIQAIGLSVALMLSGTHIYANENQDKESRAHVEKLNKILTSFFIENQFGTYDATIYRMENELSDISYLGYVMRYTNKNEINQLKTSLVKIEELIVFYFSQIFKEDIIKGAFPIILNDKIRSVFEQYDIYQKIKLFMIIDDIKKYESQEEGYFLDIQFMKNSEGEIKIAKIKIIHDKEKFDIIQTKLKKGE